MVIRTVHQSSHHCLSTNVALTTPTRMTSRATRALTDGTMEGGQGDEGEKDSAIQPLVYPKGSPEVFGPEGNTPGCSPKINLDGCVIYRDKPLFCMVIVLVAPQFKVDSQFNLHQR